MKLKIAAIAIGLISTTSICHANTANSYAVDKEYAEFENGTEILINASSQATVKPNSDTNDIAEIFISPSDDKNISHNKYDTFRVDNSGIILNNVKSKADYIINEVINGPTSLLEGNIGVKGKIAHVIITNPNGITCDNCSFSNTLSETLVSGSVDRSNNSVAIYNLATLIPKSHYLYHKFNPAHGKVAIINSKNIDNDAMYRQLNIISNGITVNTQVVSSKDVILYNNGNRVIHGFDNKFTRHVSSIRPLITPNKYRKNIPKVNFLTIGDSKNRDNLPSGLNAGIHTDHKINIYSNNAKVNNHGYLSSEGMYLSLTNNSTFKNHNQIYTSNLVLDRDKNSWVINERSGYINHYLPFIFSSSATYEEINSNEINNNEAIRINKLIDDQEIINHGVVKLLTLMYNN